MHSSKHSYRQIPQRRPHCLERTYTYTDQQTKFNQYSNLSPLRLPQSRSPISRLPQARQCQTQRQMGVLSTEMQFFQRYKTLKDSPFGNLGSIPIWSFREPNQDNHQEFSSFMEISRKINLYESRVQTRGALQNEQARVKNNLSRPQDNCRGLKNQRIDPQAQTYTKLPKGTRTRVNSSVIYRSDAATHPKIGEKRDENSYQTSELYRSHYVKQNFESSEAKTPLNRQRITRSILNHNKRVQKQTEGIEQNRNENSKTKSNVKDSLLKLKNQVDSYMGLIKNVQSGANITLSTCNSIENRSSLQSDETGSPFKGRNDILSSVSMSISKVLESETPKLGLNQFLILNKIGAGRFGQIFAAIHRQTGFLFALKKMNKEMLKKHQLVERLLLEVKIQSFLNHPNIVKIYGHFDDEENIYLMLEYLEEGCLYDLMVKNDYHKPTVKILPERKIACILKQVLGAISELHHQFIIHRDIKPENIVMTYGVCKVCDLGWAVVNGENQRRSTACGTFDYTSPEILKNQDYCQSVDLWAMGVISYQLLTGRLPFYHPSRKETYLKIINFSGNIQFPKDLPKLSRSFIRSFIQKNQRNRIPASSVLLHPFISKYEE